MSEPITVREPDGLSDAGAIDTSGFPRVVLPNRPQTYSGVGIGWSRLLADLIDRLDAVAPGWQIVDVSQKWGHLRFVYDPASIPPERRGDARRAVEAAMEASRHTCETCGQPGETTDALPPPDPVPSTSRQVVEVRRRQVGPDHRRDVVDPRSGRH